MVKLIAGIGSRKTPEYMAQTIMSLTQKLLGRYENLWVRSGHAPGADYMFERAARDRCIIYLPFPRFGDRDGLKILTRNVILWNSVPQKIQQRALKSVEEFHPGYAYMRKPGQIRCHARNFFQIMGSQEQLQPVDAVVCWAEPKGDGVKGGTGQAVRLANHYGIPVFNLFCQKSNEILKGLEKILENKQ